MLSYVLTIIVYDIMSYLRVNTSRKLSHEMILSFLDIYICALYIKI